MHFRQLKLAFVLCGLAAVARGAEPEVYTSEPSDTTIKEFIAKAEAEAGDGEIVWSEGPWQEGPAHAAPCLDCLESSPKRRAPLIWARGEFLLWWGKNSRIDPLITSSPAGTAQNVAGILGQPNTSILFGNQQADGDARSGGRITLGHWFDECGDHAVMASFYGLEEESTSYSVNTGQRSIIARPFFDVSLGVNAAQLIAYPGATHGAVGVHTSSEVIGAEVLYRRNYRRRGSKRVDFLAGYRFSRLDEELGVDDILTVVDPGGLIAFDTSVGGSDLFDTYNEFHGGTLGMLMEITRRRWTLEMTGKISLGSMFQQVNISGQTTVEVPGSSPVTTNGGLLTQPTNIGRFQRNEFTVVPELTATLSYEITCQLKASLGYSFIYWDNVVRPDDHIDFGVNPTQIDGPLVGAARPAFNFVDTDYWLQGLNIGIEYRY